MDGDLALELLGYLASILVTVSLTMRSIVRLRWINLVGAVCFSVYGILIRAYPVAALNIAVVGINLYHLWRMRQRAHEAFAVLHVRSDDAYVGEFLRFYDRDIAAHQPVAPDDLARSNLLLVLRDLVPAGLVAVTPPDAHGTGTVVVDFATPAYRDLKIGTYLYHGHTEHLRALGYRRLETVAGSDAQRRFVEKMGFVPSNGTHHLTLEPPATRAVR